MIKKYLDFHKNGNTDKIQFVEYNHLLRSKHLDVLGCALAIESYMTDVYYTFINGDEELALKKLSGFSEKPWFPKLGFSLKNGNGRGPSPNSIIKILRKFKGKDNAIELIMNTIFGIVFIKGFGADYNSDLLISLVAPFLSEYTKRVAKENNLDTKSETIDVWNANRKSWEKGKITIAKFEDEDDFHLIVPNDILVTKLPYNARDFIYRYWRSIYNDRREKNGKSKLKRKDMYQIIKNEFDNDLTQYSMHVLDQMSTIEIYNYLNRFKRI